jgi:hypothetical protein
MAAVGAWGFARGDWAGRAADVMADRDSTADGDDDRRGGDDGRRVDGGAQHVGRAAGRAAAGVRDYRSPSGWNSRSSSPT